MANDRINRSARAFTLIELMVVVIILVAMTALVVPLLSSTQDDAYLTVTKTNLKNVREAIMGSPAAPGYYNDMKYDAVYGPLPAKMADLFVRPANSSLSPPQADTFDPNTKKGWRGPYIEATGKYPKPENLIVPPPTTLTKFTSAYGDENDPAALDAWQHPIVIQHPTENASDVVNARFVRIVSAGPDGVLTTNPDVLYPDPSDPLARGDDVILYLSRVDAPPTTAETTP